MALRLRGRCSYRRRMQVLAIRMLLSVLSATRNIYFQSVGIGNMSPIGGFVAHLLTAVLGTSGLSYVSCYSPSVVATLDAQRSEDRHCTCLEVLPYETYVPAGCSILQFSSGQQAGICSLMEVRPAEEWKSAAVDLLVSCLLLSASPSEEGTINTRTYACTDWTTLVFK